MSELRRDPVLGRWVILAPERAGRPTDFPASREPPEEPGALCPFCPGNERYTPPEILAYRPAGGASGDPAWSVRVFANRFPALRVEGALDREGHGIYDKMSGIGAHEVVVETRDHARRLGELPPAELEAVLAAWRDRMLDLRQDSRLRSILVFKNQGQAAGATLAHSHSQLIALPIVPRHVMAEMAGARSYFDQKERCIYCDIVRQERKEGVRLAYENQDVVALAPWAPRIPFETWLVPKAHASGYEEIALGGLRGLADALSQTLRRLDRALGQPAYNLMLHTGPLNERALPHYHWHLELMPILGRVGGFEWGSGFYINPTPPEEAAEFLRKAVD
ncbi:MAG: galactose-1-phosphate uridylyltransferase [Deltaproteobacteria bacterium]